MVLSRAKERVNACINHLVKMRSVYYLPEQLRISTWSSRLSLGGGSGQARVTLFALISEMIQSEKGSTS